ncbi:uncharacterized protein N7515_006121 [Penicillium bovifimosum]|uniref:Uncharacterized protein n=1 Tax=Penicillium bovifimosum TaxID=126998 RepID=A0A9W9L0W0_9EURO|nr:uncharacterized protein N7515_006121 [Penicillium bovifimosum]KAJ5130082.1 hypothetical protein N7515_006121 [Penicillium bovifimosum]
MASEVYSVRSPYRQGLVLEFCARHNSRQPLRRSLLAIHSVIASTDGDGHGLQIFNGKAVKAEATGSKRQPLDVMLEPGRLALP